MIRPLHLLRSLPLVLALVFAHDRAEAQGCGGSTITADVATVSVTAGGVQNLSLTVPPAEAALTWHLLGTLSGTTPGYSPLASSGLTLNLDRYMYAMFVGTSPLVQGGTPELYGVWPNFDAQGHASLQVVVPPAVYTVLVGRTAHHGFYRFHDLSLMPVCGSNTVALTFVP